MGLAPRSRRREGERYGRPWPSSAWLGLRAGREAGPRERPASTPLSSGTALAARCGPTAASILGRAGAGAALPPPLAAGRLRRAPLGLPDAGGERGRGREIQRGGACGDGQKGRLAGGGRPRAAGALSDGAAPAFLSAPPPAGRPHASSRSGSVLALALLSASPWRRRS